MSILDIFNADKKIVSQAALPDTRPPELKEKDYKAAEVAGAAAVAPFQNERIKKLTATIFNQWYVGSCVPHGFYTQLEYEGIVSKSFNPSQLRAYRKRVNYPSEGSNGVDMYDKIKAGQSNDFPTPEKFREAEATAMPLIAGTKLLEDFKYFQYWKNGVIDHEQVVRDVAIGKAISIFFYATQDEWAREYVEIKEPDLHIGMAGVRHCVCLIPKGDFTKDGKQWLSVHDSAKFGNRHLRYISYDFLKERLYFAAKVYKASEIPVPPAPPALGLPLEYCNFEEQNTKVLALQKYLISKGFLEAQYATGYYGSLTAKALLWWQLFHHTKFTSTIPQLLEWGGKYWGQQSVKVMKELEGI